MWKRLWKNVILALCVLGMVLQPVNVFATSTYYYTDISSFVNNWRYSIGDAASHYTGLYTEYFDSMNVNQYCLYYGFAFLEDRSYIYTSRVQTVSGISMISFRAFPASDFTLARPSGSNSIYFYANKNSYVYLWNSIIDLDNFMDDIDNNFDPQYETVSSGNWFYITTNNQPGYISFDMLTPADNFTVSSNKDRSANSSEINPDFLFIYKSSGQYNPDLPSGNVLPPTEPDTNNEMFYWFMNSNFYYRDGQSALNQDYAPIGLCLTYDYLAKTHADQQYITIGGVQYDNWYYELASMFGSLALQSLTLNSIKNKLDEAFPDDQADMNEAIADQVLDNSDGTGLTVSKVQNAKSSFNDAIEVYSISSDTDAISSVTNGDWSFWSQTTLNNLGIGYTFDDAELMYEYNEDILITNQRTLLNMLGW